MDPEIATKLRAEFAQGETWGWQRALCAQATFWDSKRHTRLTDLSDRQILIALIWANFYASQWASALRLRCDETRLWKRHFAPLAKEGGPFTLRLPLRSARQRNSKRRLNRSRS
jgi:hypothetical protein